MERPSVNKRKILSEANRLVSSGLRKAAIDLLLEYLETDPDSSIILSTLGRTYLLDHQPEKAVNYLKKSLAITQGVDSDKKPSLIYRADSFSDDDMAFVDSQADTASEAEYLPDVDFPDSEADCKEEIFSSKSSSSEPLDEKERIFHEKAENSTAPREKGQLSFFPEKPSLQADHPTNDPVDEPLSRLEPAQHSGNSIVIGELGSMDSNPGILEEPTPTVERSNREHPNTWDTTQIKEGKNTQIKEGKNELSLDNQGNLSWVDAEDPDLIESVELFSDALVEDGLEEEDQDEGLSDNLEPFIHSLAIEEESDELSWDDFEDLDEFDELANRGSEEHVADEERISREERARQVAVLVLDESGWDARHLPLLQQVFFENGWSAARKAVQKEINKGLLPDELALARKIKKLWSENEQYWITFHKIKSNQPAKQADAAYKQMSWLEALRIIRSFPSLPEIEEIYAFIDETYDYWYGSDRLRRSFKAFYKYLRYRTGLIRRTLPGECIFTFQDYIDTDVGVDSDRLLNTLTPVRQELEQLGNLPHPWPKPPENKMAIKEEFLNPDETKAMPKPGKKPCMPASKRRVPGNNRGSSFGFGSSIALAAKGSD